jgi:hypothetical protein
VFPALALIALAVIAVLFMRRSPRVVRLERPVMLRLLDQNDCYMQFPVICRGLKLPHKSTHEGTNRYDWQEQAEVRVSQEYWPYLEEVAREVVDLLPLPRGEASISITLHIDARKRMQMIVTVLDTGRTWASGPYRVR